MPGYYASKLSPMGQEAARLGAGGGVTMSIRWSVHPREIHDDGSYDPEGVALVIAMKQAEALDRIGRSLGQIAREIRYGREFLELQLRPEVRAKLLNLLQAPPQEEA